MRVVVILLLIIVCAREASSQSFYSVRRDRSLIAIVGANTSTYYGDLKDDGDILDAKPSLSLGVMYYITNRIGARAEFSWVTLSGADENSSDPGKQQRNLSFTSGNYELALSGVVNLFPQSGRFYQRPNFNVYGFAGIGLLYFNPKGRLGEKKYALRPLETEGVAYSRFTPVIPFGLGVKFKPSPYFNIALEAGWRKTFTDYLDDVSTVYKDNSSFTDPIAQQLADRRPEIGLPLLEEGHIRGNPDNDDAYMLFSARVEYYLPLSFSFSERKLYRTKRRSAYRR